jgi:hypothetical protein
MRTMFDRSFASGFGASPIHGFRPMGPVKVMGQFSFDPNQAPPDTTDTTSPPTYSFDPNQVPADQGYTPPATYTPAPAPVPAPRIPAAQPPGMSDTDWAKLLAQGITAAGQGYGIYTKAEVDKMNAQAAALKAKNPSVASILPSALSPTVTILLVLGGVAVIGLGLVVALK